MNGYKHYSFDLWLTLIRSNPQFKKERSRYFHAHFNRLRKPLDEVEYIFRQVDLMVNAINERTGKNIDADEMYLMVISRMNDGQLNLHEIDIEGLYVEMETLIFEHLPVVYCDRTAEVLACLRDKQCSANILSNTGFIKGTTLRQVLNRLQLDQYFDFQLYSDEFRMSKPSLEFFSEMIARATGSRNITTADIIHVGDNPVADIRGAQSAGIVGLLVNSNQTSILHLINQHAQQLFTA